MAKWSTKNPPNKCGKYLVTVKGLTNNYVMVAERSEYPRGNYYWTTESGSSINSIVIAYQKCPEPYKEQ